MYASDIVDKISLCMLYICVDVCCTKIGLNLSLETLVFEYHHLLLSHSSQISSNYCLTCKKEKLSCKHKSPLRATRYANSTTNSLSLYLVIKLFAIWKDNCQVRFLHYFLYNLFLLFVIILFVEILWCILF